MDPYKILGIGKDATAKQIKAAYRKLCKEFHPDMGGDAAKFRQISDAYELLINSESRKMFDETGIDAEEYRKMLQSIESMLVDAFTQEDECPIRWMCNRIDRSRSDSKRLIAEDKATLARLTKRVAKFAKDNRDTKNKSSRDFIVNVLTDKCEVISTNLEEGEVAVRRFDEMLKFFNGLKTNPDSPFAGMAFGQWRHSGGWSSSSGMGGLTF